MPSLSGSFCGRASVQPNLVLHDANDHDLNLLEVRGVQKSPDEGGTTARSPIGARLTLSRAAVRSAATSSTIILRATATSALLKAECSLPAMK
jgi:hypothetical protein